MKTISAIYEHGVFRPLEPVDLPEHTHVRLAPEPEQPKVEQWHSIYQTLSVRFRSGEHDIAERHDEHQP
jgi:predicted DNA-binding antitoxin AbrB/MazE fold protein